MASIVDDLQEMFKELQASEEFDKQGLVQAQERFYNSLKDMEQQSDCTITMPISLPVEWHPAVPLAGLLPIRAKQLEIGKRHEGRVLFGTLCAEAHKIVDVMTVLEDQHGDGVRLAVYNPSLFTSSTEDVRRTYPKGANIAVKEPYLKRAQDGLLMLRVNNPQDVEFVSSFQRNPHNASAQDLFQLRSKGNSCFKKQDWKGAVGYYCKCIELALSYKHETEFPSSSNVEKFQKEVNDALLYSYSNRAEANLKLKEYGQAVQDCDQALQLDPLHLKSLFRKGRALQELGEYKLSSNCFLLALQQCPTAQEIKLLYDRSKKLNVQNQHGMFDLSVYFLKNCNPQDIPEVSNYVGPVIIRKSLGRGRGLFASEDMDIGEIMLVENAIAVSGICRSTVGYDLKDNSRSISDCVKKDTVCQVISCALSSPRILQQVQCLADSSSREERQVPDMDLFQINNGNWNKYDVCEALQNLQLDIQKLRKAMELNLLITKISDEDDIFTNNENLPKSCRVDRRWGFWALASFINHSCFPNAKCMVVGNAMFIVAVRKIAAGEEITVSYFHSLVPFAKREQMCQRMGFECVCERCMFERSLGPGFSKISESLDNVILTERLLWVRNDPKKYLQSVIEIAMRLEEEIKVQGGLITVDGKQLILASFAILYTVIFASSHIFSELNMIMQSLPTIMEVRRPYNMLFQAVMVRFRHMHAS